MILVLLGPIHYQYQASGVGGWVGGSVGGWVWGGWVGWVTAGGSSFSICFLISSNFSKTPNPSMALVL